MAKTGASHDKIRPFPEGQSIFYRYIKLQSKFRPWHEADVDLFNSE